MRIQYIIVAVLLVACGCQNAPVQAVKDHSTAPGGPVCAAVPRTGDEGMWTLDNLPLANLKERYGFAPTPEWIRHLQLSAVRFGGASGAVVSPDGLVVTNHHVALGQLQKLSTPQKDYVRDGFRAANQAEEMPCPDQELTILVSMEDVTRRVVAAVNPKASQQVQNRQRKAEIARIEKESTESTGLKSDVVSLYDGGEYWLYRYKRYTDVRLVMAPEIQAAFFGGDYDNFTYPRFCLDFAFFRLYEEGKPANTSEHYLKWSRSGAPEGELVFVAGHPGSTRRLRTVSQLEFDRDYRLPTSLRNLAQRRKVLYEYAARGPEQARQAQGLIFGVENSLKALTGQYEGLQDPAVFQRLKTAEDTLRKLAKSDKQTADAAGAWNRIAAAMRKAEKRHTELTYYWLGGSSLIHIATDIVRYVVEIEKPNDNRYEEFRDSNLPSFERRLYSPAPIYPELDEHLLAHTLVEALAALGPRDKLIIAALNGRDPKAVAHELVAGTKLVDPEFRRALVKGGRQAVERSGDPLIQWARRLDPTWRELRDWSEDNIQSVNALEGHKIAKARFAVYGRNAYPDATGTLRLSFGRILGYELGTTRVPFKTTFFGLFARAADFDNKPPFNLAGSVAQRYTAIDPNTPLNFVSTNDIIGGNSGSPVVNRQGEYVGLIFDGNIQSLVWAYAYGDQAGRSVSVHSSAILEALRKVYEMPWLVKELTGE